MGKRDISAVALLALWAAGVPAQSPPPVEPPGPLAPVGPPPEIGPAPPPGPGERPLPSLGSLGFGAPIFAPGQPPAAGASPKSAEGENFLGPVAADPTNPQATSQFVWGLSPLLASAPPPDRAFIWASAEFLIGSTAGARVPPVITTGIPFAAGGGGGLLGGLGTSPLFGGQKMLDNWRTGMKTEFGAWFGARHLWGANARIYSLFSTSDQFVAVGDGQSIINLPQRIFAVTVGGPVTQFPIYVSRPPELSDEDPITGSVAATVQTTFTGGDINLRRVLVANPAFRFELFSGYRQMHLGDELGTEFRSSGTPSGIPSFVGADNVRTRNNFYGAQVGGLGSLALGRLTLQGTSALALGVNASDLDFVRFRAVAIQGVPSSFQDTAIGEQVDYFSVAAELGARIGFRLTRHTKFTVGYTGIYWTQVRRAQEQFDLTSSPTRETTNVYVNMFSAGAEVRY